MAKILVVDDLPANRALAVTLIGHCGHEALESADGAQALAMVRAHRPDLVISDILMPTMDGYEFVRQLRADPELTSTQVIFCSAHYVEEEARNLALACGVTQVLVKPCEPQEIIAAIEQALAQVPPAGFRPLEHSFQTRHLQIMTDKLTGNMAELEAMNRRLAALTDAGLEVEVLEPAQLEDLKMGALLGVAQGSVRPARVVVMQWHGAKSKRTKPPDLAFGGFGPPSVPGGFDVASEQEHHRHVPA